MLTLLFICLGLSGIIVSYIWAWTGTNRFQPSVISGLFLVLNFHCTTQIILILAQKKELTYVNILALLIFGGLAMMVGYVLGTEGDYEYKHHLIVGDFIALIFVGLIFLTHN